MVVREQVLRDGRIDFIVAPYEADPQLAFLAHTGQVEAVISPNSSLIGPRHIPFHMQVLRPDGSLDVYRFEDIVAVRDCGIRWFSDRIRCWRFIFWLGATSFQFPLGYKPPASDR